MAAVYPMDTPSRLLRRVQQLEDMELPSLPSFQHEDLDYDSASASGMDSFTQDSSVSNRSSRGLEVATPHPLRKQGPSEAPLRSSTEDRSSSTSGSPFPPMNASSSRRTPSPPCFPAVALTSTPYSVQSKSRSPSGPEDDTRTTFRRSSRNDKDQTGPTDLASSTGTGREHWQTPGEMSRSFSGEEISEILPDVEMKATPGSRGEQSGMYFGVTDTPLTRRLSSGNVILKRPGKRSISNSFQPLPLVKEIEFPSPIMSAPDTSSPTRPLTPGQDLFPSRIPSLSHSELSGTDSSEAASIPEHTITRDGNDRLRQDAWPEHLEIGDDDRVVELDRSAIRQSESLGTASGEDFSRNGDGVLLAGARSAAKVQSIPGTARPRHIHDGTDHFHSLSRTIPLQDVTRALENTPLPLPFTPSPLGQLSKTSDFTTPRPLLNDAERRKSHVMAVLSSSGLPSRMPRAHIRGTPHPLRRMATTPISEHGTPANPSPLPGSTSVSTMMHDRELLDGDSQTWNESFVSIASSADLTSDRRAASLHHRLSRGNVSFPTILLPTQSASPSGPSFLKGLSERRADGIKINRHLNAMNKQLLDTNGELAREAELWREEVTRLYTILSEAGIQVEVKSFTSERNVGGDRDSITQEPSQSAEQNPLRSEAITVRSGSPGSRSSVRAEELNFIETASSSQDAAILEEMAERFELLENGFAEKDQQIVDLEEKLAQARLSEYSDSGADVQDRVSHLLEQLDEAEQARLALHSDFALKTEQHAQRFGEICSGFEHQVHSLEGELASAKTTINQLREEKAHLEDVTILEDGRQRDTDGRKQILELEVDLSRGREELRLRSAEVEGLRSQVAVHQASERDLIQRIETADSQLCETKERLAESSAALARERQTRSAAGGTPTLSKLDSGSHNDELHSCLQQMQDTLESVQKQCEVAELQSSAEIDQLNKEIARLSATLANKDAVLAVARSQMSQSRASFTLEEVEPDRGAMQRMEEHLEEAFREIGRLQHQVAATPHRKGIIEIRDARINTLEGEKAALMERLSSMKKKSYDVSPSKLSFLVHKSVASLRFPNTPGSLQDLSWLHTTAGEPNEAGLKAQAEYLQDQLDAANGHLDANFSRLEAAGFSGLQLAEQLAFAQNRITELEYELRALQQNSLKVQAGGSAAQRDNIDRKVDERMEQALEVLHEQTSTFRTDFERERVRLQTENERLTSMIAEIQSHHRCQQQQNIRNQDLELTQKSLEVEIRGLRDDFNAARKERDVLKQELHISASGLKDVVRQLEDQRELHTKQKLGDSQRVVTLEKAVKRTEEEVTRLRSLLHERETALYESQDKVATMQSERSRIAKELSNFETDLREQRFDSERFGLELQALKHSQKSTATTHAREMSIISGEHKQAKDQLAKVEHEFATLRKSNGELIQWRESHVCSPGMEATLNEQKARMSAQMLDLAVQTRYLKAKFTRESTFRNALIVQKKYLLLLIGGMSLNEQATLQQIASMGYHAPMVPTRKRSMKAVAIAVIGFIRARNSANAWRNECQTKSRVLDAREERKRLQ